MNTHTLIAELDDVKPEHVLRDPRVVSRAIFSDSVARHGKHYLILHEQQHYIFVEAFQHVNKMINSSGEEWSGGTQIEIPVQALSWVLSQIDDHQAQIMSAGRENSGRSVVLPIYSGVSASVLGEQLNVARMKNDSGYVLENRSRRVHLPWANANWHQKLELTDQVLFEQGYWLVLKKLAARQASIAEDAELSNSEA